VTFIPKRRRRALFKELRRHFGEVFRALAQQKECRIEEGHGICWRTMCTC
jgi:putative transposase